MLKNLKKVISTIAAVAILATSASAFAVTFPDVDESASYAGAVELLTALGVVNGDDNGKFNPDNTVTRAEFAKMVVEALGQGEAASKSSYTKFADAQGHWAAGYIEAGVAAEFINGYDETTFGPDDTVTYAQAVKMLVGAAGYEAWAQQAGGWTAGYMSYGSSLGITAGVKGVTNDTALTRAQCAVLIANAMKAPLLVTDGYKHVGTMSGVVMVPNYVQMNGYGDGQYWDAAWKTMLTEYHNAYDVKGRVTGTAKQGGCEKDEVIFQVEDARNIDGIYVEDGKFTVDKTEADYGADTVKYGTTVAPEMMFEYASAVLVKDDDTNDFTIAYIEPYGTTKTLELSAEAVRTIDVDTVEVLKSEMTSDTKDYELAEKAEIYVNGYKLVDIKGGDKVLKQAEKFIADNNKFGTVTLVDASKLGSTVTDGVYDAIMITYTQSSKVLSTRATSSANRINTEKLGAVAYDPTDEKTSVVFVKDGAEIAFEDIVEDDVVTLAVSPYADLKDLEAAVITVTTNTVSGTVTRVGDDTVVVDGAEYDVAIDAKDMLSKEYTFFLDANGVIVSSEVLATNINYGIITKFAYDTTEDEYVVTLITDAGERVSYTAKTPSEIAKQLGLTLPDEGDKFATYRLVSKDKDNKVERKDLDKSVITYKISGGELKLLGEADQAGKLGYATGNFEYKASASKLDRYAIDDTTTKILDISAYWADPEEGVAVMTADMFEDEFKYDVAVYDKNKDTDAYQFVIVTDGTNSLRPTSDIAMVKKHVGATQVNEEDVTEYVVVKNGEEVSLFVANEAEGKTMKEGTIVMYPNSSKGYVEFGDVRTLLVPDDYADMFGKATKASTEVFDNFEGDFLVKDAYKIGDTPVNSLVVKKGANADNDVRMYMGLAVKADGSKINLVEAIDANGKSDAADAVTLNVADANAYTFNSKINDKKGWRVEIASAVVSQGDIDTIEGDDDLIDWSKALKDEYEVYAPIVLAREVDGDITDVFYFIYE